MAVRGEVLSLRRAIGFLKGERLERFVVLQSDRLAGVLDTVVVAPLDRSHPAYSGLPGLVVVSGHEAGARNDHVVIVPHLLSLPLERFEPAPAGRLEPATLNRLGDVVKLVLDLE